VDALLLAAARGRDVAVRETAADLVEILAKGAATAHTNWQVRRRAVRALGKAPARRSPSSP
jgi:HEAT repeat protein